MKTFFERSGLKYAMIGSGSWATALAKLLLNNQPELYWYMRDEKNIQYLKANRQPRSYLRSVNFDPERLHLSSNINEIVSAADVLVFCIPSAFFVRTVAQISVSLEGKFIISATKGFVCEENMTIAEYFNRIHGIPYDRIGIVSGPSHAEEVAMDRLSYLTLSSKHMDVAKALCKVFTCKYIRTQPGTDIYGVEYSAALKNVYAIAAGICHGLGYGDNFLSVLITNSFNEMIRFLDATHPDRNRVTSSSAYLGDLLVTSYSQFSRNRTFGSMLGKGYSVKSAQIEMNMVAEGYYAAKCIYEINRNHHLYMPIAEAVYRILYEDKYPPYIIKQLSENLH